MSEFNIEVQGGSSVRLPTGGKYCEKDIIVTASGGTEEIENIIDQSGVLESTEGTVEDKVEQLIDKYELLWLNDSNLSLHNNYKKESIDFYIDLPNLIQISEFLRNNQYVKRMVGINTAKINQMLRAFLNSVIEEIERPFDLSSIINVNNISSAFHQAFYLREVRFVPETIKFGMVFSSSVLSDGSIQSIIDGLATVETAQTLTLHTDVKAKLTDEQLATITSKNWNLA